ncbi:MAG: hypothetical protein IK099_04280 [Clostridia bacterium]|nr:hypothetical protein [Clostridia bacterium]
MKSGSRSNALLVELLIVVMFFMLSSTVLLDLYATARNQSVRAGLLTTALNESQNVADRLYTADDAEAALREMGFEQREGDWYRAGGTYYGIIVMDSSGTMGPGYMRRYMVAPMEDENTFLFQLEVERYEEAQP